MRNCCYYWGKSLTFALNLYVLYYYTLLSKWEKSEVDRVLFILAFDEPIEGKMCQTIDCVEQKLVNSLNNILCGNKKYSNKISWKWSSHIMDEMDQSRLEHNSLRLISMFHKEWGWQHFSLVFCSFLPYFPTYYTHFLHQIFMPFLPYSVYTHVQQSLRSNTISE